MATPQLIVSLRNIAERYDYSHADETIVDVPCFSTHIRTLQAMNKKFHNQGSNIRVVWRIDYAGDLVDGPCGVTRKEVLDGLGEVLAS